jgi:hypothetical protein
MSRFAVDPRLLPYLPPTMAPTATSQEEGYLEHPAEAFAQYAADGVTRVVCEEKHMGSRAVALVCRDAAVACDRFGVADGPTGSLYTRTGRPFFDDESVTEAILDRLRSAIGEAGLWSELDTDWIVLDAELMPWSLKAAGLLRSQYAAVGAASGAVAGLVAITPSCGSVGVAGALLIGLAAGVLCSYAVSWKFRFGYDDSLDVVGVHLVAGIVGTVLIGVFATSVMTGGPAGLLSGGGVGQLGKQIVAVLAVGAYAFVMTYGIGKLIDRFMGFRAAEEDERSGLDLAVHAESAYDHGVLGHGVPQNAVHRPPHHPDRTPTP